MFRRALAALVLAVSSSSAASYRFGQVWDGGKVQKNVCVNIQGNKIQSVGTHEDNDGLVTRSSSRWGTPVGEWPADHVDEIGYSLPIIPPVFQHLSKYDEILARLSGLG